MNEKQIQAKINFLMAARNQLGTIIIVLSGGIASLLLSSDVTVMKCALFIIGAFLDYIFFVTYGNIKVKIYKLIGELK